MKSDNPAATDSPTTDHEHDHGHTHDDHGHSHEHGNSLWSRLRSFYVPHSHDSADSIDNALESSEKGIRAVKVSLVALMVTAILQVLIVLVTGSVALLADTIHNFSDALTSIPLWIAFVLGRRAATKSYTYGYRRAEDIAGLFIVAMIALSAVLAAWESVDRLFNPRDVEYLGLVAAAGVVGFIGNEFVAIYRMRVGREIGSAALVADGYHARTDGLTSLAVLFGAIGVAVGFPVADTIIGLMITVAILFILRDATKQVFCRLMDGVEPQTVEDVEANAARVAGVLGVEDVRVRWIGHRLDATVQVVVDERLSLVDGHDIAHEVTDALEGAMPNLDNIVVHVEPGAAGNHDHALLQPHDHSHSESPPS
ncbi:MAG: cation transporter [bacterium]|nr:cation transporter [bacterium]